MKGIRIDGTRRRADGFEEVDGEEFTRPNCRAWHSRNSRCAADQWGVGLRIHYTDNAVKGLSLMCAPVQYEATRNDQALVPSLRIPNPDGRKASVIFFHFGDSKFRTLFQTTQVNLNTVIEPYDRSILLTHDNMPQWADGNRRVRRNADRVMDPTLDNFVTALRNLARQGYMIDVYVFAHGSSTRGFTGTTGQYDDRFYISPDMVRRMAGGQESYTGFRTLPIRMVYQMSCYGSTLLDEWTAIGAKAAMGARFVRFNTNTFNSFATAWTGGERFRRAVRGMDSGSAWTVMETLLLGDALTSEKGKQAYGRTWSGCPVGRTVLSGHSCAKDYFIVNWSEGADEWSDDIENGSQFIRNSSFSLIAGDRGMRFSSTPTWGLAGGSRVNRP